jgi:redox-sensitive bicupin YhaK (pirin superfamily)
MTKKQTIPQTFQLGFQWQTFEPFIFCVHHLDLYPKGTKEFGPTTGLDGRQLGSDFTPKNGYRMYHGQTVPGFPVHPHRGFETITIVRKGYVDHADSIGAAGRYGQGDVQWMTAGSGVQHSEMFPLLRQDRENTVELFQIWLNLPSKSKMVKPHFKMFWSENIPTFANDSGAKVTVIAGNWGNTRPPSPPPDSWASQPESDIQIWLIKFQPNAQVQLPKGQTGTQRTLYFFEGSQLQVNETTLSANTGVLLSASDDHVLKNGKVESELLVLQARPIGERVVQYGPFVMNSEQEIQQTIRDYQATQFGGWPWDRDDMVHGDEIKRFARYPDGRIETPKT